MLNDWSNATNSSAAVSGRPRCRLPKSNPVMLTSVATMLATLAAGSDRNNGNRSMLLSVKGMRAGIVANKYFG